MFIAMRALDQVRNAVAYPNLNVKFVLSHHGLDVGSDGVTHQLTEDVAIFRTIPNLQLLHPADSTEMRQMVEYAIQIHGPIIIKSGKSAVPMVMPADYVWRYGEPALVADGEKIAIIANGVMVHRALTARSIVQKQANFSPRVINLSSLTDVNADTLLQLTDGVSHVVTVEDHSIYGGLGGIISEILSEHRPSHVVRMGMGRTFAQAGTPDELFARYGLDAAAIARNAIALTQP
jgi:transketolase